MVGSLQVLLIRKLSVVNFGKSELLWVTVSLMSRGTKSLLEAATKAETPTAVGDSEGYFMPQGIQMKKSQNSHRYSKAGKTEESTVSYCYVGFPAFGHLPEETLQMIYVGVT